LKIFYYFGHPSQFHFQKHSISALQEKGHQIFIYIKTKDVLQKLLDNSGFEYLNVLPYERKASFIGITWALIKRNIILGKQIIRHKPDLLVASDPSFSQLGFLFRIPCINFIDDDIGAIGLYSLLTYPFTKTIVTPSTIDVGKWDNKRVRYNGYMKLAYLHPNRFKPDINKIGSLKFEKYFLIRLASLSAHHDIGMNGINILVLEKIIQILKPYGKVFISSENQLPKKFESFRLNILVSDIHDYLNYAQLLICDSQSMSGEASLLGTPSIRVSSFVGKLSVLEELEHKYKLTFGILPEDDTDLFKKIEELLSTPSLKEEFQNRKQKMLEDKIDVVAFTTWFIDKYPQSWKIMKENPEYQLTFK